MKPQIIKAKLVGRGIRQTQIAEKLHVSRAAVSMTIHGEMRSAKIEAAVSDAIGLPHERVFPKGHKK